MSEKDLRYRSNTVVNVVAAAFALFHLYTAWSGVLIPALQRTIHLTFAVTLVFLMYPPRKGSASSPTWLWVDALLAGVALTAFGWFVVEHDVMATWIVYVSSFETHHFIIALAATVLLLEAARRSSGYALPIVGVVFLIYGWLGPWLSGPLRHAGLTIRDSMEILYFGFDGVYGIPVGASATLIVIFIIFGSFFEKAGGGGALMDIGKYLAGRTRGGPAKIAVIASGLFGTISGSAVANVYATGTFSVPTMKRLGYKPSFAGAVEACASTGGQIVPPVMGAAAFVMADVTGIPYVRIMAAALIPAILYYSSLFLMVDFEAARTGIRGMSADELPSLKQVLSQVHLALPILVLVGAFISGVSPMRAGLYATIATVAVSWLGTGERLTPRRILDALQTAGKRTAMIAAATGIAGMVIGIVTYTGLGLNFVGLVSRFSGGTAWVGLILVALASIILGMSVPTTVAYIIVAAVAVPALRALGFDLLPSHMFAFYFAVISMITPPVAPASLAASEVAGAGFFQTGILACKIGLVAFLVPFMFVYSPELLMFGTPWGVLMAALTAMVGVVAFSAGVYGWFLVRLGAPSRVLFTAAGLLMIKPGGYTDIIGLVAIGLVLALPLRRKLRAEGAGEHRG
ncbi:MAG: TRAP transporter permease [Firmicutes bacterium]|jgi:TRAP transporter 4TM/12TM fusion protein|nr:TRAP transporter permease [Bacillota bacterium]